MEHSPFIYYNMVNDFPYEFATPETYTSLEEEHKRKFIPLYTSTAIEKTGHNCQEVALQRDALKEAIRIAILGLNGMLMANENDRLRKVYEHLKDAYHLK